MKILKSVDFSHRVNEIVYDKKCSTIDAILIYCDENEVEYPHVRRLITEDMRSVVEQEARSKNLLRKV